MKKIERIAIFTKKDDVCEMLMYVWYDLKVLFISSFFNIRDFFESSIYTRNLGTLHN